MTRAARRGVADDDEVLAQAALELDPALRASGDVDGLRLLADQPLEAELARVVEHLLRSAREIVGEADRRRRIGQRLFQAAFSLAQRQLPQIVLVQERRIENVIDDLRIAAVLERVLQRLEAGAAV